MAIADQVHEALWVAFRKDCLKRLYIEEVIPQLIQSISFISLLQIFTKILQIVISTTLLCLFKSSSSLPNATMMKNIIQSLTTLVVFLAGAQHTDASPLVPRQAGGCAIGNFYTYDVSSTQTNQLGNPVTSEWNCVGNSGENPYLQCPPLYYYRSLHVPSTSTSCPYVTKQRKRS